MSPTNRSALVAILGGMMAAAYLDSEGVVDLGYGFAPDSLAAGALMALTGAVVGFAVLLVFRVLRGLRRHDGSQ